MRKYLLCSTALTPICSAGSLDLRKSKSDRISKGVPLIFSRKCWPDFIFPQSDWESLLKSRLSLTSILTSVLTSIGSPGTLGLRISESDRKSKGVSKYPPILTNISNGETSTLSHFTYLGLLTGLLGFADERIGSHIQRSLHLSSPESAGRI